MFREAAFFFYNNDIATLSIAEPGRFSAQKYYVTPRVSAFRRYQIATVYFSSQLLASSRERIFPTRVNIRFKRPLDQGFPLARLSKGS